MKSHVFQLPTGELTVKVQQETVAFADLCHVGIRQNPKRGFLFISKVLGKHLAVRPRTMQQHHQQLAALLPTVLPNSIFVGLAETATALAQGIFSEWQQLHPQDAWFLHSSRYYAGGEVLKFEEPHSHATSHFLHIQEPDRWHNVQTLVLIDDEITTGTTLKGLAAEVVARFPSVEQVILLCLTDWSGKTAVQWSQEFALPTTCLALLHGELQFTAADQAVMLPSLPRVNAAHFGKPQNLSHAGRLGTTHALDPQLHRQAEHYAQKLKGQKVLVLGTGEFMYPPYVLALRMENLGLDVEFCATTRSPIQCYGVISERMQFADNYGEGIENFHYNNQVSRADTVLLCVEQHHDYADAARALGAEVVML